MKPYCGGLNARLDTVSRISSVNVPQRVRLPRKSLRTRFQAGIFLRLATAFMNNPGYRGYGHDFGPFGSAALFTKKNILILATTTFTTGC